MTAEDQVLQADDRRFAAMRNEDWAAFDAVLAEELTYCHSTARLETKAEHMANLKARICAIHVNNDGKDNKFTVRYLAVYKKSGDTWRMLAWQSTKMPDA
jgi:hypothetical protein